MQGYVRRQLSVYLLDDHDIVRKGLRDLLSAHRDIHLVGDSGSARRAIDMIPRLRPDVAVLDLQLQDGTGIEVCREVRAADPTVRCLLLTSAGDDEALAAAILAGAAGYVIKLARSDHILAAVRKVGAGQPLMEPAQVDQARRLILGDLVRAEPPLTDPQLALASHVLHGLTNREIAERTRSPLTETSADVAALIDRVTRRGEHSTRVSGGGQSRPHRRPLASE